MLSQKNFNYLITLLLVCIMTYFWVDGLYLYSIGDREKQNSTIVQQQGFSGFQDVIAAQSGNTAIYVYRKNEDFLFIAYVKSHLLPLYRVEKTFVTKHREIHTVVRESFSFKLVNVEGNHIFVQSIKNREKIFMVIANFLFINLLSIVRIKYMKKKG